MVVVRTTTHHDALSLALPALRAYGFGLLSTTFPGLLGLVIAVIRGKTRSQEVAHKISSRLKRELAYDRWPTTCAILVGSATFGPLPFLLLLDAWCKRSKRNLSSIARHNIEILIRFSTILISAVLSFRLLNTRESKEERFLEQKRQAEGLSVRDLHVDKSEYYEAVRRKLEDNAPISRVVLAGRTLDLTFFALVRAVDIAAYGLWSKIQKQAQSEPNVTRLKSFVERMAPPTVFSVSSAIVMWAWFYQPDRLPRSYKTWISSAAQVDERLIEALRQLRRGNFIYGKDTGMANLLGSMSEDLDYPKAWGDPAKTVPIPCELYHSGTGPSCEWHAMTRFFRAWKFAMYMYLPLNLLVPARLESNRSSTFKAISEASQSSAFLGAFVSLFYYGVCMARTRIGPKVFGSETVTPMMWDGGLAVGNGCALCGWSILLEKAARRQEVSYFVAPRALATIFPRRYEKRYLWREQMTFAMSVAIILTAAKTDPRSIRGVFGRLLQNILR